MIEDVKKILEHYFSEELGEGAADDIAGEICQLEPKADESRLLTGDEIVQVQKDYIKRTYQQVKVVLEWPLKGWRRDDCFLQSQDAKTASIKDIEKQEAVRKVFRELKLADKNYLDLKNAFDDRLNTEMATKCTAAFNTGRDMVKAEEKAVVSKLFEEIEITVLQELKHGLYNYSWWQALKEKCGDRG